MLAFLFPFFIPATISFTPFTVAFAFAITHDYVLTPRATPSSANLVVTVDAFDITLTSLATFFIVDSITRSLVPICNLTYLQDVLIIFQSFFAPRNLLVYWCRQSQMSLLFTDASASTHADVISAQTTIL